MRTIPCSCCNGTGRVEFNGVYADTLKLLATMKEPVNGATLARMTGGVNPTAMNQRLAALERLGFAKSKRYGRQRLFEVKHDDGKLSKLRTR